MSGSTRTSQGSVLRGPSASAERKIEAFGKSPLFAGLDRSELAILARQSRVCSFRADQPIFQKGDRGEALFVILTGTVRIVGADGGSSVLAELVEGDTFGELGLLNQEGLRTATAEASVDTVLLRFPGSGIRFESVLSRHPRLSARLLLGSLQLIAGRIRRANALVKENSPWIQEARRQAYDDKLTGLNNKTFLEESLPGYLSDGKSVALLMFKPDNFKLINDTYGHEAGDAVLRRMAVVLRHGLGREDVAARYMGNELAVVLLGGDRSSAESRARAILQALNALDLSRITGTDDITLTASFGVAIFPDHADNAEDLIAAAHALPLIGRSRGGNVILFPEDLS